VLRWHAGPVPTTLLENLILLTVGLYMVFWWRGRQSLLLRTPYDLPVLLLLLAGGLAVLVAPDHRAALGLYRADLGEPIAIFYVAAAVLRRSRDLRWAVLGLATAGVILSIFNLVALAAARGHPIGIGNVPVAVYNSPNFVAMFLEPLIALGVGFLLFSVAPRERWIAGVLLTILISTELLTFSRGGYLALAALGLMAAISLRLNLKWLVAGAAVVLLLIWRFPLLGARLAQQLNAKDPNNTSVLHRLTLWRTTFRTLLDHPLFGAGLAADYPHNLWLAFWKELGLIGLIAFAVLYFGLLWRTWRTLGAVPASERPLLWGLLAGLVMIGTHGLVDTPYWKNDLSLEFWLLAGLQVATIALIGRVTRSSGHDTKSSAPQVPESKKVVNQQTVFSGE